MKQTASTIISKIKKEGRKILTEAESKSILKSYNIPVADGEIATSPEAAVKIASDIGYPVVMKIVSPDIIHKSDAGGVRLNLNTADEIKTAYADIHQSIKAHKPDADIKGVLVQNMVPEGIELIVGATFSRQFGHVVMFGLGGIFVEVIKDVAFRLAPVTEEEALGMLDEIKGRRILSGLRGQPAVNTSTIAQIIRKLSILITENPEIIEVDLNPVIASGGQVIAADARMTLGTPQRVSETLYTTDKIVADMTKVFSPEGIAVIGASSDPTKLGYSTVKNIIDGGYQGKLYPINPKADEILGIKCYQDINDIPEAVDVAVVVIPAKFVPELFAKLGKKGITGAVIISSGFAEIGNEELQRELISEATAHGVRVMGPNIFGFYYTPMNLCATFCTPYTEKGPVALTCQSGGVGMAIIGYSRSHQMGISAIVGLGNKVDIDEDDLIEFFGQDANTKIISMHIEDIKDGTGFVNAAQKVSRHKPIIALKAGATEVGERVASSHTGALGGDDLIYNAAFKKAGVVRVIPWKSC